MEAELRHEPIPDAAERVRAGRIGLVIAVLMYGSALAGIWFGLF